MSRTHKAVVREIPGTEPGYVETKLWVPKVGQNLFIELPGERLLAVVARVLSPDVVICELTDLPLMTNKSHRYDKGAFVPCERTQTQLETIWRAFTPAPPPEVAKPKSRRKRAATKG